MHQGRTVHDDGCDFGCALHRREITARGACRQLSAYYHNQGDDTKLRFMPQGKLRGPTLATSMAVLPLRLEPGGSSLLVDQATPVVAAPWIRGGVSREKEDLPL